MRFSRDNLIVLGILAVISITYFVVIYRAQSAAAEDVRTQMAEVKRRLKDDGTKASRVPPMLREIEEMKQRYNKDWDRRLPRRQELAGFLREIASGLSQEKLLNQFIQPGNPSRSPHYNCLPITMEFEGKFLALAGFLKRVDEMTRLTRIERLTIESRPPTRRNLSQKDTENLTVELGMNIYFTER